MRSAAAYPVRRAFVGKEADWQFASASKVQSRFVTDRHEPQALRIEAVESVVRKVSGDSVRWGWLPIEVRVAGVGRTASPVGRYARCSAWPWGTSPTAGACRCPSALPGRGRRGAGADVQRSDVARDRRVRPARGVHQTGSGGYGLMGLTRQQIIDDVLDRYEAPLRSALTRRRPTPRRCSRHRSPRDQPTAATPEGRGRR